MVSPVTPLYPQQGYVSAVSSVDTTNSINAAANNNLRVQERQARINATNDNNASAFSNYQQMLQLQQDVAQVELGDLAAELSVGVSSSSGSGDTASLLSADLLSLSPQALNVLNGIGNTIETNSTTNIGIYDELNSNLTLQQQAQLTAIAQQYSNSPVDQATFSAIENALAAAGINPQQISMQEVFSFSLYPYFPTDTEHTDNTETTELT